MTAAHQEARREQILNAVFECLSRKGYSKTTIRDIAAESGLSLGTLYLYFENKDEMVRALSEWMRNKSDAQLEEQFPEGNTLNIILKILSLVIQRYNSPEFEKAGRVDLGIWAESLNHPQLRNTCTEALKDRIVKFSGLISRAQEEGILSPNLQAEPVARVFMALLAGLEVQKLIDPDLNLCSIQEVVQALISGSFTVNSGAAIGLRNEESQ